METNFVELYYRRTQDLARTIVVKSEESIGLMNEEIRAKYGNGAVDPYDPTSWRYYRNVSGLYHFADTVMKVTSLDTLEEIDFTKENLRIHKATAKAYAFGTRNYYSLVSEYPTQEILIRGILYPAELYNAIDARAFTILSYPKDLVEPQEITLIDELQTWIYNVTERWLVQALGVAHNLYHATFLANLYLAIYTKLINLRLKRCKTYEAHTFHIREYLASHGRLDRYLPYMTLKQALYFYRNIRYIDRNNGKVEMFTELVDKVLTDRHISISEFSVRHLSEFDDQLFPVLTVRKKPINTQYNVPEKDYFDMATLYSKEYPLALSNREYLNEHRGKVTEMFQTSPSSVVQTKDLESAMFDYNNALPDPILNVLHREWLGNAMNGRYTAVVQFKDPATAEVRTLSAKDAYIYMSYVKMTSEGARFSHVPTFVNEKERRHPLPTVEQLLSLVPNPNKWHKAVAIKLLETMPPVTKFLSITAFYEYAYALYEINRLHWYLVSNTHDMNDRAYIQNMVLLLHCDRAYEHDKPDQLMGEWLADRDLPGYSFTPDQADKLVTDIFQAAVGLVIDDTKVLANVQKAMLALLKQLSSYSIQIIRDTRDGDIRPINWAAIRVGDVKETLSHIEYTHQKISVIDLTANIKTDFHGESAIHKRYDMVSSSAKTSVNYRMSDVRATAKPIKETMAVDVGHYHIDTRDKGASIYEKYPGESVFNELTLEQQLSLIRN